MKDTLMRATLVGAALALLEITPAQAAGTVHYDFPEECVTYSDETYGEAELCYRSSGQTNYTITPSGNEVYVGQTAFVYTFTAASFSYSDDFSSKYRVLVKAGDLQKGHESFSYTSTANGVACTFTDNYTFANGEVRHLRATNSCV